MLDSKIKAQNYGIFQSAYKVRGRIGGFTGHSSDARVCDTCERCGMWLMNVYVFANADGDTMHVGIDCAAKMGADLSELRKARRFFSDSEKSIANANARALHQAKHDALVLANRLVFAESIAFLESLLDADNLNAFELNAVKTAIGCYELGATPRRDYLPSILERLELCETSEALPVGDKLKAKSMTCYRDFIALDGYYGVTYINFMTDGVSAYVYKGSHAFMRLDTLTANWTVKGSETRDGLTSTVIQRPSKLEHKKIAPFWTSKR